MKSAIMLDTRSFQSHTMLDRLPTPGGETPGPLLSPPISRSGSLRSKLSTSITAADEEEVYEKPASGAKTNSFFGSPFASSFTPEPPAPPRSSGLLRHDVGARTPPLPIPKQRVASDSRIYPSTTATHPTPPPSIHSPPSSADDHRLMPPMSRFFPSRVSGDPKRLGEDWSGEYAGTGLSPTSSIFNGFRREFYTPTHNYPSAPPTVVSDLSRSSSRSSGFTHEFPSFESSPAFPSESIPFPSTSVYPPSSPSVSEDVTTPSAPSRFGSHDHKPIHVARETRDPVSANIAPPPEAGTVIGTEEVPLTLIKPLGSGAFSSVWLAQDTNNSLCLKVGPQFKRRRSESVAKQKKDEAVLGLKPIVGMDDKGREERIVLHEDEGESAVVLTPEGEMPGNRVVAVKMMDRALCDVNDRTRISFVREVEVLRHISHPCIVSFLQSFTTPTHHCLVLEPLQGGELFDVLNSDDNHARMTEPLLRKMWGELCRAVGWMHSVALVHRDIKLENILLTVNPFATPGPIDISQLPKPLVKLTDFGLARFIDPKEPLLTTRCGSESYAAPEIVIGSRYDGRKTDAWACGVVLYALVTQSMPFDRARPGSGSSSIDGDSGVGFTKPVRETRRSYLMRIAKGEYSWPSNDAGEETARLATEGVKRVVGKLLVREAAKRASIVSLWSDDWMKGEGAPAGPLRSMSSSSQPIEEEDGDLVDSEGIAPVAMEEVT